jgi:hypothetical protein
MWWADKTERLNQGPQSEQQTKHGAEMRQRVTLEKPGNVLPIRS